jgi:hypothetical protein
MFCITAQHINIIAKEQILVNHFCNNFDLICPNHWANSRLWVWMVCTPLSNIRAMPENPTALTTRPKINPIMSLLMIVPYLLLGSIHLPAAVKSLPAPCTKPDAVWQADSASVRVIATSVFMLFPYTILTRLS